MSKYRKTIIDLMKDEDENKPERNWASVNDSRALRWHVQNHGISEDELFDLLAGDKRDVGYRYTRDALKNWGAEHNKPSLMDRVLDKHYQDFEEADKKVKEFVDKSLEDKEGEQYEQLKNEKDKYLDQRQDAKAAIYEISKHGNLSDRQFQRYAESDLDIGDGFLDNPNINTRHLMSIAEHKPDRLNKVLDNQNLSPDAASQLLQNKGVAENIDDYKLSKLLWKNSEGYDYGLGHNPDMEQKLNIDSKALINILDNSHNLNQKTVDMMLDHVSPEYRDSWINDRLGIKAGNKIDPDLEDDDNWDNWERNDFKPEYNRYESSLANSRHLSDSQAEHIKRHGSFDQRYDLYHNEHIDPKHGAEMFQKWYDDDHHHGYDSDELVSRFKEDKDDIITHDELDKDTIEEIVQEGYDNGTIDEAADAKYSISEWIDDNEDEIVKGIVTDGDYSDDVTEDADQRTIDGYDDWTAPNPNSEQNVGNPVFDALDSLHQEYFDSENYLDVEDIKNHTGIDDISKLGLTADEDDQVSTDDIKAELDKFGGPSVIDYANHEDYNHYDHPEWSSRQEEHIEDAVRNHFNENRYEYMDSMYLYEDHRESDRYQEALSEAREDYIKENVKEHLDSLYDISHQDTRFIPSHLHTSIPNFAEIDSENRKRRLDGPHRGFLDSHIKDRSYNHEYGENQHHHEMMLDYANVNNGKIDIGTMNRFHPNQKDIWKSIFDGKGKLTSEEIQDKIENLPKTNYAVSYGQWGSGKMQNLNGKDQVILRLDHSNDSIKPLMEDKDLYNTFKKVQDVSKRSGHPTNSNTIGWARIDTSVPKHWMIDEVQSDFGKSVINYLKREGAEHKAEHVQKIQDYHKNWREAIMNAAIKEAKKHGVEKVSTHSPESKSSHANYGSSKIHSTYKKGYKQVPRAMGFQPVHHSELPINESGRKHFEKEDPYKEKYINDHLAAHDHHMSMWKAHDSLSNDVDQQQYKDRHLLNAKGHLDTAQQHAERLKQLDPVFTPADKNKIQPDSHHWDVARDLGATNDFFSHDNDNLLADPTPKFKDASNEGHTYHIVPKLKKYIQEITDLYKSSKSKWLERFAELRKDEDLNTPSSTVKLNPEHGKMIADAYHNMEHQPDHPEVKSAYGALINETKKQYQDMMNSGFKISRIQPGQPNPYKNSKELHDDIRNNNHMWYFPTEHGYGSDPSQKVEHPMLQGTGHFHDDNELLANDLFRIVHDYYGHHKGGESGFGPKGEHRAYLTHKKMFSPMAQKALASETLGQNSWVNYGPHADHNKANPANTIYADQKAGLLPDHIIQGNWHMADNEIKKAEKKNQKTQEDKIHESLDKLRVGYEHDRGDIDTKTPEGKEKIKGKLTTKGIHSSLYSIPSEKNIKGVPKKTGHQAGTINVFGAHYPVVKVLNDNTLLLHTSDYGDAGEGMGSKTRQLVEKIQKEVPEYFPDMKIIKIHHPDYTHSARVMRDPNSQIVSDFLNGASQHHPDEEYRQHALEAHQHLNPVKKGFNTKPIHQKRIEGEGWDGKKNIQNRVEKLGRYLQKIGLTVDQPDGEYGRTMGESSPTGLGVNPKGDPHDQQLIHEAGHAVLTPEDARLEDYQEFIGAPGPDAKIKASRERQSMQSMHGGGMPEQTAQHAEASIARRSGINPFRVPKRGRRSNTAEEGARRHAKEQIELLDEGIHRFDPVSGKKEIQPTVNAHINAKARKDKHLKEKVRNKLKQKMKEKKRMRQEDPMGYDFVYSQNSRLPKSEKITNNINKNDDMDASTGVSDPFITDQEKIDMDRRKDRRRRFKKQLLKEENLEKGIMDGIRNTAIIAGLAAGAHNMSPKKQPQALRQPLSVQAEQARQKRPMDDYSKRIRDSRKRHFFRSADRKLHLNKIMSTVANNPELKERYGHMLKSPYDMVQATRKNPDMKEDIYHTHFNNLYDVHEGNLDRIEESWSKPE